MGVRAWILSLLLDILIDIWVSTITI